MATRFVSGTLFCVLFVSSASTETVQGQASDPVRQAQVLTEEATGASSPVGMAFSSTTRTFYVVEGRTGGAETQVTRLDPFSLERTRPASLRIAAALKDPINIAFDQRRNRLLLLGHARELFEVQAGVGGDLERVTLKRRDAARLGLKDPQGLAVDPGTGAVFVVDAALPRIVRIDLGTRGDLKDANTSEIDLRTTGLSRVRGIAFDPSTGNLHVGTEQTLVELTQAGEVVAMRDLSALALTRPEGMVFAPTGDLTDDPAQQGLYVADRGSRTRTGQIVELSLAPQVSPAVADFTSQLVRTVNVGALSPPSPDPSGITYVSTGDKLVITDGEVEETVMGITHFQGANVWELSRTTGNIIRTANISKVEPTDVPMTDEPTGITWKPGNGHYFVTEDGGKRVYDLNPGGDGLVGTPDDTWTFFRTNIAPNDNVDPEGIAYDTRRDRLFVADGTNREIYEYTTTGTVVGHFDVQQYGVEDPETVEFNYLTGTLFVLSNRQSGPIIIETTISGALLQTIDVSAAGAIKPAGLALAPATGGPELFNFYFVDRGIDNDSDPNIVDGKLFEMTAPRIRPSAP